MSSWPGTVLRIAAVAEAVSWTGLLVGMLLTYVVVRNEVCVQILGPVRPPLTTVVFERWALGRGRTASAGRAEGDQR